MLQIYEEVREEVAARALESGCTADDLTLDTVLPNYPASKQSMSRTRRVPMRKR